MVTKNGRVYTEEALEVVRKQMNEYAKNSGLSFLYEYNEKPEYNGNRRLVAIKEDKLSEDVKKILDKEIIPSFSLRAIEKPDGSITPISFNLMPRGDIDG